MATWKKETWNVSMVQYSCAFYIFQHEISASGVLVWKIMNVLTRIIKSFQAISSVEKRQIFLLGQAFFSKYCYSHQTKKVQIRAYFEPQYPMKLSFRTRANQPRQRIISRDLNSMLRTVVCPNFPLKSSFKLCPSVNKENKAFKFALGIEIVLDKDFLRQCPGPRGARKRFFPQEKLWRPVGFLAYYSHVCTVNVIYVDQERSSLQSEKVI